MFGLGALDDVLHFSATTKLVVQTIVAGIVVFLMPPRTSPGSSSSTRCLSLVWIVGITNAFNLLDNIDGLSAGIAAVAGDLSPRGAVARRARARCRWPWPHSSAPRSDFSSTTCARRRSSWAMAAASSSDRFSRSAALLAAPELKAGLVPVAAIPALHPADSDLRHGVCQRDAPPRGPQPAARRTRSSLASARGARHRRTARRRWRSTCSRRSAASSPSASSTQTSATRPSSSRSTSSCSRASGSCSATSRRTRLRRAPTRLRAAARLGGRVSESLVRGAARPGAHLSRLLRGVPLPLPGRGLRALPDVLRGVVPAGPCVSAGRPRDRREVPPGLAHRSARGSSWASSRASGWAWPARRCVILYLPYRFEGFSRLGLRHRRRRARVPAGRRARGDHVGRRVSAAAARRRTSNADLRRRRRRRRSSCRTLLEDRTHALAPIGFIDDDPAKRTAASRGRARCSARSTILPTLLVKHRSPKSSSASRRSTGGGSPRQPRLCAGSTA